MSDRMLDWETLLMKYIDHVSMCADGVTFAEEDSRPESFTDEEWVALVNKLAYPDSLLGSPSKRRKSKARNDYE